MPVPMNSYQRPIIILMSPSVFENNITAMPLRRYKEMIHNLHHIIRYALTDPSPTTLSEEQRCSKTKLHPRQM
jgi:hypothetical protein